MTRKENYHEAIRFLQAAEENMDQFLACMKAAGLQVETGSGLYRLTDHALYSRLDAMLQDLKRMQCDDCAQAIADHVDAECGFQRWSA